MKDLLIKLTVVLLFFTVLQANAQTETETLEWLNVKKNEAYAITSNVVSYGDLELTSTFIKVSKKDAWSKIDWKDIKDIKTGRSSIYSFEIVSKQTYEGANIFIAMTISDDQMRSKYMKALKHMAELKGATLVKDDLFGE